MNQTKRVRPVVAIDGPAGAGKSTVTRLVAERLGYTRVDTGALYRTVAFICIERGVDLMDQDRVASTARELAAPGVVELSTSGEAVTVRAFERDVTTLIRSREASLGASQVSQVPAVRDALLEMQRGLGRSGGVVLEGRDIGSVVFPDSEAKFYLTASAEVRAERRRAELEQAGKSASFEAVIAEVNERDRRDTERPIAPLVQAVDALVVDSSQQSIEQVVDTIVTTVQRIEEEMGGALQ